MKKQFTVDAEDSGIRLDKWFKRHMPEYNQSLLQKMLRKKDIRVNGSRAETNMKVEEGDIISAFIVKLKDPNPKPNYESQITNNEIEDFKSWIVFENNDFLAINKPQGLPSQGGSGIKISVDDIIREISPRYKLVHRLDKDTSGVLVIAKKTTAAANFSRLMQTKKDVDKTYIALVKGTPKPKVGSIDLPLMKKGKIERMEVDENGKKATTYYRVLQNMGNEMSLVELKPITGRTHQLRAHCLAIGHPIIGDGKYGGREAFIDGLHDKLHLHAKHISIPELEIEASAQLPEYLVF